MQVCLRGQLASRLDVLYFSAPCTSHYQWITLGSEHVESRALLRILQSTWPPNAGIGVQLFASVKYRLNLDRQVNFRSFSNSFLFLFQVLTGRLLFPSHFRTSFCCLTLLVDDQFVLIQLLTSRFQCSVSAEHRCETTECLS